MISIKEKIKLSLELTRRFMLSKGGVVFFLLLFIIKIPFFIRLPNILFLFLLSSLLYPEIKILNVNFSNIFYLIILILILFSILNLVVIGSLIVSVSIFEKHKKIAILYSIKTAIKKLKKLFLASLLIIFLNILVSIPWFFHIIFQEFLGKQLTSEFQDLHSIIELEKIKIPLVFSIFYWDSFYRIGKPIIPISNEVIDSCIINRMLCPSLILFNTFNPVIIFTFLLSLVFIFILQEVVLTDDSLVKIVRRLFQYFKNNFKEICIVWLISALIFISINLIISPVGYLFPLLPAYIGQVLASLLVIIFQTFYYLNFRKNFSI